jgi:DNA-binding NarL/FixJ family response regulator
MPIKVAIVEDNTKVRESLTALIGGSDGFRCVGSFPNAEAALENVASDWPDVVLMDINLPRMSGIECVSKLKALRPTVQIIMVTVYLENEKIFQSLVAGASGYLIKQTPPAQILEAISDVHRGGSPMSSNIARKLVQYVAQVAQVAKPAEKMELSPREHEILSLLAKGYQYKEIAESLAISVETVRTHLRNIYEKLHVRSRTEAVVKFFEQRNGR